MYQKSKWGYIGNAKNIPTQSIIAGALIFT